MTAHDQRLWARQARIRVAGIGIALMVGATACAGGGSSGHAAGTALSPAPTNPPVSGTPAVPSQAPVPVEQNPPGDIPDNLAFVPYSNPAGGYSFTHPEGWAQTENGSTVGFTDKLNGVSVSEFPATSPPTEASARSDDVARLVKAVPAFQLEKISPVSLPAGSGVLIVFQRNSDPDPVTGRAYRDEVQEFEVFAPGKLVRMDLYGPVGADNVDAYRTMSTSLRLR